MAILVLFEDKLVKTSSLGVVNNGTTLMVRAKRVPMVAKIQFVFVVDKNAVDRCNQEPSCKDIGMRAYMGQVEVKLEEYWGMVRCQINRMYLTFPSL